MGSHVKDMGGPSHPRADGLRAAHDRPLSVSGTEFKGAGSSPSYQHPGPTLTPRVASGAAHKQDYAKRGAKQSL